MITAPDYQYYHKPPIPYFESLADGGRWWYRDHQFDNYLQRRLREKTAAADLRPLLEGVFDDGRETVSD